MPPGHPPQIPEEGLHGREEAQQIQMEANQKMVAVIEEHEFTPQRYTEITNILNADEELREEFEQIYRELIEDKDGPLL